MDRWKTDDDPVYWCAHCGADNWEPDPHCWQCGEWQPDSRTGRILAEIERRDRREAQA